MDTARPARSAAVGDLDALEWFRLNLYTCATRRADALFELGDTLAAGGDVATLFTGRVRLARTPPEPAVGVPPGLGQHLWGVATRRHRRGGAA